MVILVFECVLVDFAVSKGVFHFEEPGQNLVIRSQQSYYKLEKVLIEFCKRKKETSIVKKQHFYLYLYCIFVKF